MFCKECLSSQDHWPNHLKKECILRKDWSTVTLINFQTLLKDHIQSNPILLNQADSPSAQCPYLNTQSIFDSWSNNQLQE